MRIREAVPEDDVAIGELLVEAFTTTYARRMPEVVLTDARRQELRSTAEKRREATVWVLELEGVVRGTVALYRPGAANSHAWLPNAADLRQLAVDPALHGQGYAGPLMDEAERRARAWGVDAICLHVRQGARGVAAFYQRRGYEREPHGDLNLPSVYLEAFLLRVHSVDGPG